MKLNLLLLVAVLVVIDDGLGESLLFPGEVNMSSQRRWPNVASWFVNESSSSLSWFGRSMTGVGDLNNDGYEDLGIGAPKFSLSNAKEEGAVWIFWGHPPHHSFASFEFPSLIEMPNASLGLVIFGSTSNPNIGHSLSAGCDLNDDGVDDLIIGTVSTSLSNAAVHVVFGQSNQSTWTFAMVSIDDLCDGVHGFTFSPGNSLSQQYDHHFGQSPSHCLDFNGDGRDDLVVSDWSSDNKQGRVVVLFGQSSWKSELSLSSASFQSIIFTTTSTGEQALGQSLSNC